ncbi:unnamed protein product [Alopecurus aequalis]
MASPTLQTIPEDLLVEIFLHLTTLAALACSAAAYTSFRRLIKGSSFRHRFRSLHRPPLLSFMDLAGFHPVEDPHLSASIAGSLALCIDDFSFVPPVFSSSSYFFSASRLASYFPIGLMPRYEELPRWRPRDARDGRVLLDWVSLHLRSVQMWGNPEDAQDTSVLMDCNELAYHFNMACAMWTKREPCNAADFHLAGRNPLSHIYELLPTIPEDLASSPEERLSEFVPMLAPASATEDDESFKVICMATYQTKLVLFFFISTPTTKKWHMVTFPILNPLGGLSCFDCVCGRFYWTNLSVGLLVLDTRTIRFSTIDLFTGYHVQLKDLPQLNIPQWRRLSVVVVGREGAVEMISLVSQEGSFTLHHTSLQNHSHEWRLEKIIPLPGQYEDYSIPIMGAAEGFLFFRGAPQGINNENFDWYSLDVKTYEITKVCSKKEIARFNPKHAFPFFRFPPFLSEPTV